MNKSTEAASSSLAIHRETITETSDQVRVAMNVSGHEVMQERPQVESSMRLATSEQESEEVEFTLGESEIPMHPSIL